MSREYAARGSKQTYWAGSSRYIHGMPTSTKIHRTTIEIDAGAFAEASQILGTTGYKQTVNAALREVGRSDRLRRGAALIDSGRLGLVAPDELARQRRPRND